ncbi:acetyl-CoA carboxylase biotin carboxyl carrier protein [soil metagenome]
MIDIRKLKELVRLMVENDLTELNLQDQAETVTVKRGVDGHPVVHHPGLSGYPLATTGRAESFPAGAITGTNDGGSGSNTGSSSGAGEKPSAAGGKAGAAPASDAGLVPITSPMVGTFYASPNPDSPAFIQVGAAITPETTVCLLEAMKVFNEIKAETTGTIERILVKSGQSVEYGTKMFMVRPS